MFHIYFSQPEQREAFVNPLYDPSSTEESIRASFRPQVGLTSDGSKLKPVAAVSYLAPFLVPDRIDS